MKNYRADTTPAEQVTEQVFKYHHGTNAGMPTPTSAFAIEIGRFIAGALVWAFAGFIAHEASHLGIGYLAGGQPKPTRHVLLVPTRIDFDAPKAMSDSQTRLTGGIVIIFPAFFALGLWLHSYPLIMFGAGGCVLSAQDLLAVQHPEMWKALAAGEAVTRDDWD